MSSSIKAAHGIWNVQNMMFWRVLKFAWELGWQQAVMVEQLKWVDAVAILEHEFGVIADLRIEDLFQTVEEIEFWDGILSNVATAI